MANTVWFPDGSCEILFRGDREEFARVLRERLGSDAERAFLELTAEMQAEIDGYRSSDAEFALEEALEDVRRLESELRALKDAGKDAEQKQEQEARAMDGLKDMEMGTADAPRPEIAKILTLGTAHISEATAGLLDAEPEDNALCLSVYPKTCSGENVGWFVYLDGSVRAGWPEDLKDAVRFAAANGCSVLCLDSDGPGIPELPTYDWDAGSRKSPAEKPAAAAGFPEPILDGDDLLTPQPRLRYHVPGVCSFRIDYDGGYEEDLETSRLDGDRVKVLSNGYWKGYYSIRNRGFLLECVPNHEALAFAGWQMEDFLAEGRMYQRVLPALQELLDRAFPEDRRAPRRP